MTSKLQIIGLTGGIGAGKSLVASTLESLGCIVADADNNAKLALQEDEVKAQLVDWWGDTILDEEGMINRAKIASIVFEDESELRKLEALLHPRARAMQEQQFAKADSTTAALVIDAPLLIETGLDALCDVIIYVDASQETRKSRVLETRDWDAKELVRREASQLPLDNKKNKADYIVINEGEPSEVQHQVQRVLEDIRKRRLKS